jgi:hypothetical protein
MFYEYIHFNTLFVEIKEEITKYCNKFDFEFEKCKNKTKKEILIHFSVLEILKQIEKNKNKKIVVLFDSSFCGELYNSSFKQISKILFIPVFFCDSNEIKNGLKKEIDLKAEEFYNSNIFTQKTLKKHLCNEKNKELFEKIVSVKSLRSSQKILN